MNALRADLKARGKGAIKNWTRLGSGISRTAYTDGIFVVKEAQAYYDGGDIVVRKADSYRDKAQTHPPEIRRKFRYSPRLIVRQDRTIWEIQLKYNRFAAGNSPNSPNPATDDYDVVRHFGGDLHFGNIGRDHRGRLVAFDF
jgi:hypothetical protein